jgi:hypothetical protein
MPPVADMMRAVAAEDGLDQGYPGCRRLGVVLSRCRDRAIRDNGFEVRRSSSEVPVVSLIAAQATSTTWREEDGGHVSRRLSM